MRNLPVGAVILGGTVAIVTALSWFRLFPQMAKADRFEEPRIIASEPERIEPQEEPVPNETKTGGAGS